MYEERRFIDQHMLIGTFQCAQYYIGFWPTNPRMETIGPLPLTPPRTPYERVSGGGQCAKTGRRTVEAEDVWSKNKEIYKVKIKKFEIILEMKQSRKGTN